MTPSSSSTDPAPANTTTVHSLFINCVAELQKSHFSFSFNQKVIEAAIGKNPAVLDEIDSAGNSLLHQAIQNKQWAAAQWLAQRKPVLVLKPNGEGKTPSALVEELDKDSYLPSMFYTPAFIAMRAAIQTLAGVLSAASTATTSHTSAYIPASLGIMRPTHLLAYEAAKRAHELGQSYGLDAPPKDAPEAKEVRIPMTMTP